MDDNAIRAGWKTGAICQIYSNSKKKWFVGEVAQIFTDEEGEWLEVRYDKSMSKQVQRYSSDIRPSPEDLKRKKKPTKKDVPFQDTEMKPKKKKKTQQQMENEQQIRQSWDKGDEVEIFSNTHQSWYLGEVVDIIKDDEGEWLNCVWARANGEAMSKQVQRFSTDVRPVQDDHSSSGSSSDEDNNNGPSPKDKTSNKTPAEKIQDLAKKIASRKTNFRRRAPPFSRTLRPSTFTYPATSSARRSRKLLDLEETNEKNQHVIDHMPNTSKRKVKKLDIASMKSQQVREFIRSLGSAYERYANNNKLKSIRGSQLVKFNENQLQKIGINHKLHRCKILVEVAKNSNKHNRDVFESDNQFINWSTDDVKKWLQKHSSKVISIYANKFYNHGINGMLLFDLDSKDLKTIEVKKIHQKGVLEQIAIFREKCFPSNNDEEKEQENNHILTLDTNNDKINKHRTRGSVAHIDVTQLQNGGPINGTQNNDAIIYTMGHLLLELGKMFNVGKIQNLTQTLERQLVELQENTVHPQLANNKHPGLPKRQSLKIDVSQQNDHQDSSNKHNKKSPNILEKVDNSPTGLASAAAWIKTNMGAKDHKRRASLPYINAPIHEDDDDDEDISDIE